MASNFHTNSTPIRPPRSVSAVRRDDGGLNPLAARARRVKVQALASRLGQGFLRHLSEGEYDARDLAGAVSTTL